MSPSRIHAETANLRLKARAVRWRTWQRCAGHSSYLRLAQRLRGRAVVGPDTQLVIEGFPRTANTFAVFAFQSAQVRPVRIAHHLHAAAQLTVAARSGVPALVLIRPPEDVVVSTVMWWPHVTAGEALGAYARFYERVLPDRDRCVVGRFDEVTSDFGSVIDRVNRRFGTTFERFVHSRENVEHVYQLIEERARGFRGKGRPYHAYMSGEITTAEFDSIRNTPPPAGSSAPEMRVARPSAVRDAAREGVRGAYLDPRLSAARLRAERVYRSFVGD
jgi:hypothetical protein